MRAAQLLAAAVLCGFLAGCASQRNAPEGTVTVGTFNMEWLGDGPGDRKPRTDADYLRIADIVIKSGADVLGVQEVENEAALRKVLRYCQDFDGMVLKGETDQNVGVIWRKSVTVDSIGPFDGLVVQPKRSRPGLVVRCRYEGFDWLMMVVHLKSTSRFDSTNQLRELAREIRSKQAAALRNWSDSVLASGAEQDVLIVGDMNDFPSRRSMPTLTTLVDSPSMRFLTKDMKSCGRADRMAIDHVIASTQASKRAIASSIRTEDFYAFLDKESADNVSDHCPVLVRFHSAAADND
jgi:endonuclease/exonuclease/phosphatase family metal-dependent hydrolase